MTQRSTARRPRGRREEARGRIGRRTFGRERAGHTRPPSHKACAREEPSARPGGRQRSRLSRTQMPEVEIGERERREHLRAVLVHAAVADLAIAEARSDGRTRP